MKKINTYSEYILNETLKTHELNSTIKNVKSELNLLNYDFSIQSQNNTITINLHGFRFIKNIPITLEYLDSLMIDRHGWFPSKMYLVNLSENENELSYNEDYLIENAEYLEQVSITYEAKYDKKVANDIYYHISIQEYKEKIINKGLIPKSKSKLSKHLDRIYICKDVNDCYSLIPRMKLEYNYKKRSKSKINDKWIIYEIDLTNSNIDIFEDPNYEDKGFYCVDNIPKNLITIIDEENGNYELY